MNSQIGERALEAFVETINATGGVLMVDGKLDGCAGDEEWLDLADAYMTACNALGRDPVIQEDRTYDAGN